MLVDRQFRRKSLTLNEILTRMQGLAEVAVRGVWAAAALRRHPALPSPAARRCRSTILRQVDELPSILGLLPSIDEGSA